MSRIEDLIAELCPGGVEHLPLRDVVAEFIVPMRDRPKIFDGDIPWCRIEDIEGMDIHGSKSGLAVSPSIVREMNLKVVPTGTLIASCSASLGRYAIASRPLITNQTFIGLVCGERLFNRFLLYVMFTKTDDIRAAATTGTIAYVSRQKFESLLIPVPPLEVQREIVRILDNFTELESELESELEARRQQFDVYRRKLLSVSVDAPVQPLGELAENLDSKRKPVTKAARTPGDIPYFGASGIVDYVSDFLFDGEFLLVSEDGANLLARSTPIAFSITGRAWVNNHAHVLRFNTYVERRFVEIFLNSIDLSAFVSGATQPKLNQANLNRIPIPALALETKTRIVAILDQLDALMNDLSIGLPAELAARRKQYEYYRDRLLTFDELPA